MKIAIIGCKRQKQDYTCPADEMYEKAFTYKAQRNFIKQAYDDYFIFSSKYGIIHHTKIIEPYDITLQKVGTKYQVFRESNPFDEEFIKHSIAEFMEKQRNNTLHFHTTLAYMSYVKPFIKTIDAKHIKQMQNTGMVKERYAEALEKWDGNLDTALEIIQKPIPPNPESEHQWYHPTYNDFFGTSYQLWKKYKDEIPKFDQAVLRRVGFGVYGHHKQWRIK